MTDYYKKYLKYKQKYIYNKYNYMSGGNPTKLTKDNIEIIKISKDKDLDKEKIIELTKICEPDDTDFIPVINEPHDIFWLVKYKDTEETIGYIKSTDLEQFKENENFELLGGIKGKKGLQITGACNGIPIRFSNMASLLLEKIERYAKKNNYDYILLHAGTDRDYLVSEGQRKGLYIKNGFRKVRILKADEGKIYNIDAWIMIKNLQDQKMILVDGTSSAGKTTICKYFTGLNYKCFQIDNYWNDPRINFTELFKNIKNEYNATEGIYILADKYMVDDALNSCYDFLLDHITQKEILKYLKTLGLDDKLFIINVFTNLKDLARNLESRRKEGDSRGVFAFTQFSERYIKTSDDDEKKIEKVNREKFKKLLLKYFKYEFKNEEDLLSFVDKTFNKMDITDDEDHYVKLRDELRCDYLLITTGKSKENIFEELEKKFKN